MSSEYATDPTARQPDSLDTFSIASPEDAEVLVRALHDDSDVCSWCFTQIRRTFPEFDAAEAEALSVGGTNGVFRSKGHRIAEDGTVAAAESTTCLTPEADHVDDAPVDTYRRPKESSSATFCGGCGRGTGADAPSPDENRTTSERYDHFENIVHRHLPDDVDATPDRGRQIIDAARQTRKLQGQDTRVLAEAIYSAVRFQ